MQRTVEAAFVAAWTFCSFSCSAMVAAQSPLAGLATEVPEVTIGGTRVPLELLLEFASSHAPSIAVATAELALADSDASAAHPLLSENATMQAGLGGRRSSGSGRDWNGQLQLMQPIEIGGQRRRRARVAGAARGTRLRHLERERWRVHQEIHAGYHQSLALLRRAEVARQLAVFAEQLVAIAQRRVGTGDASQLVAQLAQAEAAQARQRAVAAHQDYRDACLAMAEVSGWSIASPPEPIGSLPTPRHAPALADLLRRAREANPDLLVLRAVAEETDARADLARRDALPDPRIGAQYAYEGDPGGNAPEHVIMALLRIPISSFDRNQADRAGANAERRVAVVRRDTRTAQLEVRLERLRTSVDAAATRAQSYESDILPRFRENLVMLRRAFELGEIDVLRVSIAMQRLLEVQDDALDAQMQYFTALASLEAQVGSDVWEHEEHER